MSWHQIFQFGKAIAAQMADKITRLLSLVDGLGHVYSVVHPKRKPGIPRRIGIVLHLQDPNSLLLGKAGHKLIANGLVLGATVQVHRVPAHLKQLAKPNRFLRKPALAKLAGRVGLRIGYNVKPHKKGAPRLRSAPRR
jgi:hypothetical protein